MAVQVPNLVSFQTFHFGTVVAKNQWLPEMFELRIVTEDGLPPNIKDSLDQMNFQRKFGPALPDPILVVNGVEHRHERWLFEADDWQTFVHALEAIFGPAYPL